MAKKSKKAKRDAPARKKKAMKKAMKKATPAKKKKKAAPKPAPVPPSPLLNILGEDQ